MLIEILYTFGGFNQKLMPQSLNRTILFTDKIYSLKFARFLLKGNTEIKV